jgi:Tetratricopeptide repeat
VVALPTSLADSLAHAASLQEQYRFAAARDTLVAALPGADTDAPPPGVPRDADRLAVATGRRMLAEVLRDLGQAGEAYAVAAPLVSACERWFGPGHPATAGAMTVLATVRAALGDLDGAAHLFGQVLDGRFSEAGPAAREVRLARAHLALLYRDRGDPERARAALDSAYRGLRRAYGIADADVIRFGVELAGLARQSGDLPVARRLLTVARAGSQARLAPSHPLRTRVEAELSAVAPDRVPAPVTGGTWSTAVDEAAVDEAAVDEAAVAGGAGVARPAVAVPTRRRPAGAVPGTPPGAHRARQPGRRRRTAIVAVAAAVLLAALVAGLTVATTGLLTGRHSTGRQPATTPGAGTGPAAPVGSAASLRGIPEGTPSPDPLRVQLRDDGTDLVATWRQPPGGPAPIVIALARDGKPPTVVATVPAGTTRYTITGTDPHAAYCVIVAAVYPGAAASGATSICTRRATPSR